MFNCIAWQLQILHTVTYELLYMK